MDSMSTNLDCASTAVSRSTMKPARAPAWALRPSSVKIKYTRGVSREPQNAGINLKCQRGTLSVYSWPILSKLNRPSNPAKYPATAAIIFPRGGLESKKKVFLRYRDAYFP